MCGRDGKRHSARQMQKRPLIVRFNNYKDKSTVWEKRFELKGHDYSLSENYSRDTEFNRQKLYALFKKAKNIEAYKKKVFFNGDILVIDGEHFTVDNMGSVPNDLQPRQFSEKKKINISFLVGYIVNFNHSPTGTPAMSSSKVISLRALSRRISGPKQITARMQQQRKNCCMPHLQEKPKT